MSFAVWNWMKVYARWREKYLQTRPKWRLPDPPEDPIITLGPRGEEIMEKSKIGILLIAVIVFLALGRSD